MDGGQPHRMEAERLLGEAEKLLLALDFNGSKEFALLAKEADPLLEGSDQILAIADVLIAANRLVNGNFDWYGILQIDSRTDDAEQLVERQYRHLSLLLDPGKNKFPYADLALRLVTSSWEVFSDPDKKMFLHRDLTLSASYSYMVDLLPQQQVKLPVRGTGAVGENPGGNKSRSMTLWTTCPNCSHGFSVVTPPPTPVVVEADKKTPSAQKPKKPHGTGVRRAAPAAAPPGPNGPKKRGRPRKNA